VVFGCKMKLVLVRRCVLAARLTRADAEVQKFPRDESSPTGVSVNMQKARQGGGVLALSW
jgi:hypothetical protein